jgi:hypothetical protein
MRKYRRNLRPCVFIFECVQGPGACSEEISLFALESVVCQWQWMAVGKPWHYNHQFLEFLKLEHIAAFVSVVQIFPIVLDIPNNKTRRIPNLIKHFSVL